MATDRPPALVRIDELAPAPDDEQDLRGRRAFDRSGVEIGVIDGLLVDDRERRTRFLRVEVRSPLDDPRDLHVLVPVETIRKVEPGRIDLDLMRERVLSGPVDDPSASQTPDRWAGLYDYYGLAPFWSAG